MHEMGIACSILEAVEKELLRYPGCRATKVGVRIGEFAGVDGDSLRFCFEAMVKDSPQAPLELGIEALSGDELDLGWIELDEIDSGNRQAEAPVPHMKGACA
jgi:hydrogenase nickel incorporation protein HypA/HybF